VIPDPTSAQGAVILAPSVRILASTSLSAGNPGSALRFLKGEAAVAGDLDRVNACKTSRIRVNGINEMTIPLNIPCLNQCLVSRPTCPSAPPSAWMHNVLVCSRVPISVEVGLVDLLTPEYFAMVHCLPWISSKHLPRGYVWRNIRSP
jgi:hypothetical protein